MRRILTSSLVCLLSCGTASVLGDHVSDAGASVRPPLSTYACDARAHLQGAPATSCGPDATCCFPGETSQGSSGGFWLRGEYLLWWTKDGNAPPLVTTGPQAGLGILGQPGTQVLYGDQDYGRRSGGRFSAIYWLDECQTSGVGGSFFFLGQGKDDFVAASPGNPVLARPFFNVIDGVQDIEQVANLAQPALPNLLPLSGRVTVDSRSRLWGAEANAISNLRNACGRRLDVFAGFRYLSLDEGLLIGENLLVPNNAPAFAGTRLDLFDSFATRNDFYGGQVGARAELQRGRWFLEVLGKVALGATHQQVLIDGATVINAPGLPTFRGRGGLLALPSNIGNYTCSEFAVVPEVNANVGYQLSSGLRAFVGYNFLYWSDVARPGDQIDVGVNPTQLPPGALVGPARPAFFFDSSDFWAHGVNFGLELRY